MRSNGYNGTPGASMKWGGLLHGFRYMPRDVAECLTNGHRIHPFGSRVDGDEHASLVFRHCSNRWVFVICPLTTAIRRIYTAKFDRRQRRARVAKKIAARAGRRHFAKGHRRHSWATP